VSAVAAVPTGCPPATGKSTLAMALVPRLDAAVLDLDVATAPLTRVVSELTGVHDLDRRTVQPAALRQLSQRVPTS